MAYVAPVQQVTASTYLEIVNAFRSILAWRGHTTAMKKSMYHAAVMMGEIDEPDDEQPSYDPLASAGFFGIMAAVDTLIAARNQFAAGQHEEPSKRAIAAASPVAVQLLFALMRDEDALAVVVRWMRDGYIGYATSDDSNRVDVLVGYLRKMVKFSEDFEKRAAACDWESPLSRHVFPARGKPYDETLPVERVVPFEDAA